MMSLVTNGRGAMACETVRLFIMDVTTFLDDEPSTFKVFGA
jgi:hypothetical protein